MNVEMLALLSLISNSCTLLMESRGMLFFRKGSANPSRIRVVSAAEKMSA